MKAQPLLVHFLFHPDSEASRKLARHIHTELNGDLIVPGLRVPTIFYPLGERGSPFEKQRLELAERNLVVVLADDHMAADDAWRTFSATVWDGCRSPSARFLPIQLSANAWPLDDRLKGVSFAQAHRQPEEHERTAFVVRRIVVELCRYISDLEPVAESLFQAPVTLFLSHAKADLDREPRVVRKLIDALKHDQPIEAWVDSGDIASGSRFAEAIEQGVARTSLLVVLTDAYGTREWCREEVLLAKEHQRPVAVVDALTGFEARSFPYLGNVPRIRYDGDPQVAIDLLLKETLRHLHATLLLDQSKLPDDHVFARPPEMATLVGLPSGTSVLYPDPPVGSGEAKRLAKAGVIITTPLERLAARRSLAGRTVALSMSESTDIAARGFDPLHFEHSMLDMSRYLLIGGAKLAYGGHLGAEGYTRKLFELVRMHNNLEGVQPFERIVNHRGWPLPRLTVTERAELNQSSVTVELPRPSDIDETLHADFTERPVFFPAERSREHRFAWARGMSEMRAFQADMAKSGVIARVILGGTFGPTVKVGERGEAATQWYAGRVPGVLEEIYLSVEAGQPVFLIGAFGGAAKLAIDIVQGVDRPEATWDYQRRAPFAPEMRTLYEQRGVGWVDYPEIVSFLRGKGMNGTNPLLNDKEQAELFVTVDPQRMVELVVAGLGRLT